VIMKPELISQALERAWGGNWLPQEMQARRENLRRGRRSLERQVERLTEAYLNGVIPLAEYERRRREIEQRQEALDEQARQMEMQVEQTVELAGVVASVEDFTARVRQGLATATFEQRRLLVELLIDRVVVSNEEVEIRYVVPTNKASEQIHFSHLRADYRAGPPDGEKEVRASQCFKRFHTSERTLAGVEAVNMIRKGQVKRLAESDAQGQAKFVASLFQIAA
jgi:site-specific DNA recombinase